VTRARAKLTADVSLVTYRGHSLRICLIVFAAAAAAGCDVTRERSVNARTRSRITECPVADQLCRGL